VLWLGIGSGGGVAALLSLAGDLPDPDFALNRLLPALAAFVVGVASAAASILLVAKRDSAGAFHHGESHNRDQLATAIDAIPEVFAAPESLALSMNAERNELIAANHRHHGRAEAAWRMRRIWNVAFIGAVSLSAAAFGLGAAYPIIFLATGGRLSPSR
jgi:hypothetical protein